MKITSSLLNRSEENVLLELESIAEDNNFRIFSKVRLSDVIIKDKTFLTQKEFDFYTRCHCDFVITDFQTRPILIVEYDGPYHVNQTQQERDTIKNDLCERSGLGLLRIHDKHVTRSYRGMSILRWIVEVIELEKAFYEAQSNGQIPYDEPFDPAFMFSANSKERFPYWLSAPATQSFHKHFNKNIDQSTPYGWSSIMRYDKSKTTHRLSYLYFEEKILFSKTSIRRQNFDFPDYDLLSEIDSCELGIILEKYNNKNINATNIKDFHRVFSDFCTKFDTSPSHSMGAAPFKYSWDIKLGIRLKNKE